MPYDSPAEQGGQRSKPDSIVRLRPPTWVIAEQALITPAAHDGLVSVSVIIPCYNAASTLRSQLAALAQQVYEGPWEVVVVDNRSSDGSANLALAMADRFPRLRVIRAAERQGVSYARNAGARAAQGDLLVVCDADDIVGPHWLDELVRAAHFGHLATGVNSSGLHPPLESLDEQISAHSFESVPFASGCNMAVWKYVHELVGGFDELYAAGADDVEYSLRVQLLGGTIVLCPSAWIFYRPRPDIRSAFWQWWYYSRGSVRLYRQYKSRGMTWRGTSDALRSWLSMLLQAPALLRTETERRYFAQLLGRNLGRLAASAHYGVWAP